MTLPPVRRRPFLTLLGGAQPRPAAGGARSSAMPVIGYRQVRDRTDETPMKTKLLTFYKTEIWLG
jgi:hypothetical protein